MDISSPLSDLLMLHQTQFRPVVPFDPSTERLVRMDFSENNKDLNPSILSHAAAFEKYVNQLLGHAGAKYGFGGYAEHRTVYSSSAHFDDPQGGEPRRLHLGIDIWGPAGTPVFAPLGGLVHSFAYNHHFGDYGATIILSHQLDGRAFYTLYGHLSLADIANLKEGQFVVEGTEFAHFGNHEENGNWPPHLHFQVIDDIGLYRGDYPGVCRLSEREHYLSNCPDPDLVLNMRRFLS